MKVAGFTFIRNAISNDYPIVEAITSILPVCDEFVIALGNSDDDTTKLIESIGSPKIRVIHTFWNESLREGGSVFAAETDKAFAAISPDADWAFYIQGDECIHEKYLPVIMQAMEQNLNDQRVEGLLFKYLHFYGSYDYYAQSRRWYRREIRILRNNKHIHSYRDAQGFRWDNRKIQVKLIDAYIYHYGWVKPPAGLKNKVRNFNQFYHDDAWLAENMPAETFKFDFGNADRLLPFEGTHPAVMQRRINAQNWKLEVDAKELERKMSLRRRILQKIEDITGWRISEYRNYKIIK
ncbi:glycosyltransferase family 2 protein [Mucilaginibacter lacusdianchii]|uniref:glycosyltransferase family 2 protein n=1 Tax=Mucilaginibacter lacusdianchii TaxID=2684211 RepID=UPI00131CA8CA|nr:glycosyltransferase family 2 protein [Mucilaginibacter sp. JXJ CY 39]